MPDHGEGDSWMDRHRAAMAELRRIPGVVSVGFGLKVTAGELVPQWAYRVYVGRKRPMDELSPEERIPREVGGIATDVIVGDPEQLGPHRKTPTLSPGNRITRYIPNDWQESGTLGLLVRKGTERFILTNDHVLSDSIKLNDRSKDVYSPKRKTSAEVQCNNPAARLIERRGVKARHPFDGKDYYVDATLATVYAGVEGSNIIEGIGPLDQGLRDLAAEPLNGSAPAIPIMVQKYGARTGLTQGTVEELFHLAPAPGGDTEVWNLQIRPTAGFHYEEEFELAPGQDAVAIAGQFDGMTVQAQVETTSGSTILKLSGLAFGRPGDSGSCVVDDQRRIVGLYHSGYIVEARVMFGKRSELIKLPKGSGSASFIRPVLDALELNEADAVIPPATPSSGRPVAVIHAAGPAWATPEEPGLEDLQAVLHRTSAGRRLLRLAHRHAAQVAHLVHHRRRVMVSWHRVQGPGFAAALLRAAGGPDGRLPPEIEGVRLVDALHRMRAVLMAEGDAELRQAVRDNGDFVLALAERATSVPAILDALALADP
jgi:hypothetical protein